MSTTPPHSALGAPSLSPPSSLSLSLLYPNAPVRVFLKVEEDDEKEEKNTRGGGGGRRRRRRRRRSDGNGDEDASRTFTSDVFALGLLTFASTAVDAFRIVSGRGRKEGEKKKKKMNKKKREPPRVSLSLLVDESIGPENRERERLNT